MKIFSLKSKTDLVVWSVILGALIAIAFEGYTRTVPAPRAFYYSNMCSGASLNCDATVIGFPFYHYADFYNTSDPNYYLFGVFYKAFVSFSHLDFLLNVLFWVVVVLIILSIIRYFKYKNKPSVVSS